MSPKSFIRDLWDYEKKVAPKISKKGPTVTVSGKSGTGKSLFGKKLAREMGLRYLSSGDLFRRVAKEKGYSVEKFAGVRKRDIDLAIDERTLKSSLEGNCVIVGRLACLAAGKSAEVRLLLTADPKVISQRLRKDKNRKYYQKPLEEVMRMILDRDQRDARKYEEYYGIDIDLLYTDVFGYKMPIYHAVLDNSFLPVKDMFKLILEVTRNLL